MSVSDETHNPQPVSGAGRNDRDARENGAAYAREAVELLTDSMRPGDDFADKHLSQATVHAVLALYCELRHQAETAEVSTALDAGIQPIASSQQMQELTEALRRNTEALVAYHREGGTGPMDSGGSTEVPVPDPAE